MAPTRAQMKKQMELLLKLSQQCMDITTKFDQMCVEYYGEERYSDHDLDEIIDALDYGTGELTFERFDELMKEINTK